MAIVASAPVPPEGASEDSLRLRLLERVMEHARGEIARTDLWHRLMPRVSLAVSFGIKDILFLDPSAAVPYVMPRDAYRLTFSLSLGEILDGSTHTGALLNLERARTEYEQIKARRANADLVLRRRRRELKNLSGDLEAECLMKQELATFDSLRFQQGAIGYDALVRSRLDLLKVQSALGRVRRMIGDMGNDTSEEGRP